MREDQCLASSVGPRVKPEDCARMLRIRACFVSLSFAGLVVLARSLNPIPSRTRPLNSSAPMVLWLKPWESRSLPGLPRTRQFLFRCHDYNKTPRSPWGSGVFFVPDVHALARDAPTLICFGHDWPPASRRSSLPVHFKIRRQSCSRISNRPQPRRPPCVRSFVLPSPR